MSDLRLRAFVWFLTVVYATALLIITHLPPSRIPKAPGGDKLWHFCTYAILAALLLWSVALVRSMRSSTVWVVAAVLGFAAIDELTQPLVGRSASWTDWLSDAAGAISGVAVILVIVALRDAQRN